MKVVILPVINFDQPIDQATSHANLINCTVSPFCELATTAPYTIICNLQSTPYDDLSHTVKMNAYCDNLMRRLVEALSVNVPPFAYTQDLVFAVESHREDSNIRFSVKNARVNEPPTVIETATLMLPTNQEASHETTLMFQPTPLSFSLIVSMNQWRNVQGSESTLRLSIEFRDCYEMACLMYDFVTSDLARIEEGVPLQFKKIIQL